MNPLLELIAIDKKAREFGFEWPNAERILEQILSECEEVKIALENHESIQRLEEEIGDLLHAAISLCLFMNLDPHHILNQASQKFAARFQGLTQVAAAHGYQTLKGQPMEVLMQLWNEMKQKNG